MVHLAVAVDVLVFDWSLADVAFDLELLDPQVSAHELWVVGWGQAIAIVERGRAFHEVLVQILLAERE